MKKLLAYCYGSFMRPLAIQLMRQADGDRWNYCCARSVGTVRKEGRRGCPLLPCSFLSCVITRDDPNAMQGCGEHRIDVSKCIFGHSQF